MQNNTDSKQVVLVVIGREDKVNQQNECFSLGGGTIRTAVSYEDKKTKKQS